MWVGPPRRRTRCACTSARQARYQCSYCTRRWGLDEGILARVGPPCRHLRSACTATRQQQWHHVLTLLNPLPGSQQPMAQFCAGQCGGPAAAGRQPLVRAQRAVRLRASRPSTCPLLNPNEQPCAGQRGGPAAAGRQPLVQAQRAARLRGSRASSCPFLNPNKKPCAGQRGGPAAAGRQPLVRARRGARLGARGAAVRGGRQVPQRAGAVQPGHHARIRRGAAAGARAALCARQASPVICIKHALVLRISISPHLAL